MRTYETTIILDAQLEEEMRDARVERYAQFLTDGGATEMTIDRRGTRRLAYLLNKRDQGDYTFLRYIAPEPLPADLERETRIDEAVLRFMTILLHPRPLAETERLALMGLAPKADGVVAPSDDDRDDDEEDE